MAVYLKGERADDASALERAAELLGHARLAVISGLMTDIAGAEAALALARKLYGVIDHAAGEALSRSARLTREAGECSASFGEVRNRADFVVMLGDAPLARHPVLLLDLFPAEPGLARLGDNRRELIVIGTSEVKSESRLSVTTIPLGDADLPTLIAMLGLVSGTPLERGREVRRSQTRQTCRASAQRCLCRIRLFRAGLRRADHACVLGLMRYLCQTTRGRYYGIDPASFGVSGYIAARPDRFQRVPCLN
jgi:formylmethanofuran dehydrogenase subunit B